MERSIPTHELMISDQTKNKARVTGGPRVVDGCQDSSTTAATLGGLFCPYLWGHSQHGGCLWNIFGKRFA